MVSRAARFVQALRAAIGIRRVPSRALEQPRLRLGTAAPARSVRYAGELRGDSLVVPDRRKRSMPGCAICIDARERVGERRVRGSAVPARRCGMHR
jgi:hypothetical protein